MRGSPVCSPVAVGGNWLVGDDRMALAFEKGATLGYELQSWRQAPEGGSKITAG